VKATAVWTSV